MFVILFSTCLFGISLGFIQGYMDPESHRSSYVVMYKFSRELELSQVMGMYLGAFTAVLIEALRQMEVRYRKPTSGKNSLESQLEQHADSQNLDFEDDPEEFTPGGIWAYEHRQSMGHNNFNPLYDEDEERISLVNVVSAPVTKNEKENYQTLELKSDSESDEEKL